MNGLLVPLSNLFVEALTPSEAVLGNRASKEVLEVEEVMRESLI